MRYPLGEIVKDAQTGAMLGAIVRTGGNKTVAVHHKNGSTFFTYLKNLRVATGREAKGGV